MLLVLVLLVLWIFLIFLDISVLFRMLVELLHGFDFEKTSLGRGRVDVCVLFLDRGKLRCRLIFLRALRTLSDQEEKISYCSEKVLYSVRVRTNLLLLVLVPHRRRVLDWILDASSSCVRLVYHRKGRERTGKRKIVDVLHIRKKEEKKREKEISRDAEKGEEKRPTWVGLTFFAGRSGGAEDALRSEMLFVRLQGKSSNCLKRRKGEREREASQSVEGRKELRTRRKRGELALLDTESLRYLEGPLSC